MPTPSDAQIIAQSIWENGFSYFGKENLRRLGFEFDMKDFSGVFTVVLKDNSGDAQLDFIDSFAAIQDLFFGEADLALSFSDLETYEAAVPAETRSYSYA